jgi:hypothetical protein
MRDVLTAVLIVGFVCCWCVAAYFGRDTLRGGSQDLFSKPWLGHPADHAALLKAVKNRHYEIKYAAMIVGCVCLLLLVVVRSFGR